MKFMSIVVITLISCGHTFSQNIFEDESGETTLNFASDYYFLRFNTSETSLKLGGILEDEEPYGMRLLKKDWGKFINVNLKFSATDGLASLYDDGKVNFGYEINLKPGIVTQDVNKKNKARHLQICLDANLGRTTYKVADSLNVDGYSKTKFTPKKLTLNVNYIKSSKWFFGGAVGFAAQNNVDELSDGNVVKQYFGNSGIKINNVTEVKIGEYKSRDAFRLDGDIAFLPGWFEDQIGFTVYQRSAFFSSDSRHDSGLGIFILPKASEKPIYSSIGGIGFTFRDISNSQESDKNTLERGIFYLFAGFKIAQ
jgi:hypothetical protein